MITFSWQTRFGTIFRPCYYLVYLSKILLNPTNRYDISGYLAQHGSTPRLLFFGLEELENKIRREPPQALVSTVGVLKADQGSFGRITFFPLSFVTQLSS